MGTTESKATVGGGDVTRATVGGGGVTRATVGGDGVTRATEVYMIIFITRCNL